MKVNRRGLLGLFGGAAAAGPSLAKGIAETTSIAGGHSYSESLGYASKAANPSYIEARKKQLKSIIAGTAVSKQRSRTMKTMNMMHRLDDLERLRLDSLRSVSPGQKMRILIDGMAERDERVRIASAEFELFDLLNPLKDL